MENVLFTLKLHKESDVALYQQLAEQIAACIRQGELKADSKLPPIRKLAEHLGVNTVTVVSAYKHLESKQMVYSRMGSGTYVSPLPIEEVPEPVVSENIRSFDIGVSFENAINFADTSPPHSLFPTDEFKKAFNQVLDREKGSAFGYMDSMGYAPLRQQLCYYLEDYGIKTDVGNVQIISGAQQGIDIISKAMIRYGDVVFVEKPTFYGAAGAFLSRGAKLVEVPLEEDGMQMDVLEDYLKLYHPRFIYMMAYYQTPTGYSYSLEKKRRLLELADKYDTFILEEDSFYDFHYAKEPLVPLKALDYRNRVVYIKSFSKILMPGLRMGLMVLPKRIAQAVAQAKYTTDISTSGFIQKAMTLYLEENSWKKHNEEMRKYEQEKYRHAIRYAGKYLSGRAEFGLPQGGISLWIGLPELIEAQAFCSRMLEKHVILTPGSQFQISGQDSHFVRLSFANVSDEKIEVGLKRMAETIDFMLKG